MSVWLVHNALAGAHGLDAQVERAAEAVARRGVSLRLERVENMPAFRNAARAAVAARAELLLVAGGDGSLSAAAGELAGSATALGCLPAGTVNAWARALGLPLPTWHHPPALAQAALAQLEGEVRRMDLARCNGQAFLLWAGLGLDAYAMQRLADYRPLSRRYGMPFNALMTALFALRWRGQEMRVEVAGPGGALRRLQGRFLLVVAANLPVYSGLFPLGRGQVDDGQLEVWAFAGDTPGEAYAHVLRLTFGLHRDHPRSTCLTGPRAAVYTRAPLALQMDGNPLPPQTRWIIESVPRALRVAVPARALAALFDRRR